MIDSNNLSWRARIRMVAMAFILGACALHAQILASYDHIATNEEFAAVSCNPAVAATRVDPLLRCGAAPWSWWFGCIAADNMNQMLFYAAGNAAESIQFQPFSDIGTGVAPACFPVPGAMNQITGLVVDPRDPSGRTLWATDGFALIQCQVAPYPGPGISVGIPATLYGPIARPAGAGLLTGLAWHPSNGRIFAVDAASRIWRFDPDPAVLNWAPAPILPGAGVAVPPRATGIAFCRVAAGGPAYVSYFNGTVMRPSTGAALAFPPSPTTPLRHHHGLSFLGLPISLGGRSIGGPRLSTSGLPHAGNPSFALVVETVHGGPVFVAIDPTNPTGMPVTTPSTLVVNPANSLLIGPLPNQGGSVWLPIPLAGLPAGFSVEVQAVEIAILVIGYGLTDGLALTTFAP